MCKNLYFEELNCVPGSSLNILIRKKQVQYMVNDY